MEWSLDAGRLDELFGLLSEEGYTVIGPRVRDGVIVLDELREASALPQGWRDEQECGTYRLMRRDDEAFFGFQLGPQSWKKFLFPQRQRLWKASLCEEGFEIEEERPSPRKLAFLGLRACELNAIAIQDRVFTGAEFPDPHYLGQREELLMIAVQCVEAGQTCFCVSMGTGPAVKGGVDICMTELVGEAHSFVLRAGSSKGEGLIGRLTSAEASEVQREQVKEGVEQATRQMGRTLETKGLKERLMASWDDPHWEEIASRCLSCANCTMVCPTCFCSNVEDVTDITGEHAERWRQWDSCFHQDFSYIHGGAMRISVGSRYRQWMTHKLSTWHEQFGTSGCVGCGRCLTWCPAHIDLTKEASQFQQDEE